MDDINHDHSRLPGCKFGYMTAVRSCDVIKGHQNVFFLLIASHRKELQHHAWSHYVQFIKTHRMIGIHFDLEVTLRLRDLWSTDNLDLMRSRYEYSDAYQREDFDGPVSFALAQLVQVIGKKLPCSQVPPFRLFFTPVTSFLA